MTSLRVRSTLVGLVGLSVIAAVAVWWAARGPDAGAVDRVRDVPEPLGVGAPQTVAGPVMSTASSLGDPTGGASGQVTESMLIDIDDDRLTAVSLRDGETVWTYGRDGHEIDDWAVSGDVAWVLFDDRLLVRVDAAAGEVAESTVFEELHAGDTYPSLTGDGAGGVVLQGLISEPDPVWWAGADGKPLALDVPSECDAQGNATSDGDRIYLVALCDDDTQQVVALRPDGSQEWARPMAAWGLAMDGDRVVVRDTSSVTLLDPASGEVVGRTPPAHRLTYFSSDQGLAAGRLSGAGPAEPGLAVWSTEEGRFVWKQPGLGDRGAVSEPLVQDGRIFYTQTRYGESDTHRLAVVDIESGQTSWTRLTSPGPKRCEGGPTELRPDIETAVPGGLVVGWEDGNSCAAPTLEVYAAASS